MNLQTEPSPRGLVHADGEVFPNVFEALGFTPEEAKQMMLESDRRAERKKQAMRLALAVGGKAKKTRWARFPRSRVQFKSC